MHPESSGQHARHNAPHARPAAEVSGQLVELPNVAEGFVAASKARQADDRQQHRPHDRPHAEIDCHNPLTTVNRVLQCVHGNRQHRKVRQLLPRQHR